MRELDKPATSSTASSGDQLVAQAMRALLGNQVDDLEDEATRPLADVHTHQTTEATGTDDAEAELRDLWQQLQSDEHAPSSAVALPSSSAPSASQAGMVKRAAFDAEGNLIEEWVLGELDSPRTKQFRAQQARQREQLRQPGMASEQQKAAFDVVAAQRARFQQHNAQSQYDQQHARKRSRSRERQREQFVAQDPRAHASGRLVSPRSSSGGAALVDAIWLRGDPGADSHFLDPHADELDSVIDDVAASDSVSQAGG